MMETRSDVVICDRSVLDNYAYLVHQAGRLPEYDALVKEWVATYDRLFKVPIIDAPTFDGQRDVSRTFQQDIDGVLERLVLELGVTCHRLDPAAREAWVDTVLTTSGLPLYPPQSDLFPARG